MTQKALTPQQADKMLRHCLEKGEVIPGKHFRDELEHECLTFEQARSVLRGGRIYSEAEQDLKTAEWTYRVEGWDPDGKWLAIVFCFKSVNRAFLITIFSIKRRSKKN